MTKIKCNTKKCIYNIKSICSKDAIEIYTGKTGCYSDIWDDKRCMSYKLRSNI